VNAKGTPTSVSFEYGLDTNYGSTIAAAPIPGGANTGSQYVSAQLTGLQPATTYHFRAVATGAVTVTGSDQSFTTLFPFASFTGRYGSLLVGVSNTDSGLTIISLTSKGTYSASVRLGTGSYSFAGSVSQSGTAGGTTRGLRLSLELSATTGAPQVTGSLGGIVQEAFATAPLFSGSMPSATYTTYLPAPTDSTLPQGNGYGILTVVPSGSIYFTGELGDAHAFTASGSLLTDGTTGLLYGTVAKGAVEIVLGTVLISSSNGEATGTLAWVKPQTTGTYTPDPISTTVNLVGAAYKAPSTGPVITSTIGNAEFAYGDLVTSPLDIPVSLTSANKIITTTNSSTTSHGLTISITPSSGLFKGSFYDPTTHALRSFQGVLLQGDFQFGAGVFPGVTEAGSVMLFPPP